MLEKSDQWDEDPEYLNLVSDLLSNIYIKKLAFCPHHYYSNRLAHSIKVSYDSYLIGKKLHLNLRALARGGLLHDLFYYDWRDTGMTLSQHNRIHPIVALHNAEKLTYLTPMEKDIILKHMWGATPELPSYLESFVVSIVDDYCAVNEMISPVLKIMENKFKNYIHSHSYYI